MIVMHPSASARVVVLLRSREAANGSAYRAAMTLKDC